MSSVRIHRPKYALATMLRKPGGTTVAEAVERAETNLEGLQESGWVQLDEPALREGLPLRREDWPEYLGWAVESFRIAASGVGDATQIHTHMCYAQFGDILDAIAAMDAPVVE